MADLNLAGESYAHSLIAAGKVDKTAPWSFEPSDGNALLGKTGDDWESYSKVHLGLDRAAADKTKSRYKYPFSKGGKMYRSGIIAAKQRAAQQGDREIEAAAGSILDSIDKPKSRGGSIEYKYATFEYKFASDGPDGTFEGYGSVFNNEDDYGDMVAPGAFTKTLAQYQSAGSMPKMLLNHGSMGGGFFGVSDPMADMPIGKWNSMSEDSHGLQCKGQLINLDTERGKTIHGAMKERQLDGLSIGYQAKDFVRGTKENEPKRTLKAVHLIEVSPVTFPANTAAMISSVKSRSGFDITALERVLRNAGLSRTEAKALLAQGFKGLPLRDVEGDEDEMAAIINRAAALLRL